MAKRVPLASLSPAARAKRIAILAKNPGTRSAIPTKYLPAQYKAGRATAQRMKQENATIYNPTAVLSGNDLRTAVKAEVNANLNPQLGAFDRGIKDLTSARNISSSRLAGYSNLYNQQTASAATALSSSGQQLVQQLQAAGQQTQNQLQGIQSDINNRNAADVAVRGAGLQDNSRASAAVDFNKAQAAGATASAVALGGGQAGANAGLAGNIAAIAPMRANDQQAALAGKFNQQIADMMGKRADLEATRGDLTTKTLNQMRQDQFTNLATMKGLDIKQADLQETARSHKANEALTGAAITQRNIASVRTARSAAERLKVTKAKNAADLAIKRGRDPVTGKSLKDSGLSPSAALDKWRLDFARKNGYLPSTGKPGGTAADKPKLTSNERITQAQKFGPIKNVVQNTLKPDFPNNRNAAAKSFLADNPAADPLYVSIALDMAYDGHISRPNTKKLKDRGINVADLNGVTSFTDWQRKTSRTNRKNRQATRSARRQHIPVVGGP